MINNKYDPRLKKYDELTNTFVYGENLLEEIKLDLKPVKGNGITRQSWIITGPRGAGKSHLLTLLYHEIEKHDELNRCWTPLIFPEELFRVDSLYRLIIEVLEKGFKNLNPSTEIEELKKRFKDLKKIRLKGSLKKKAEERYRITTDLLELLLSVREKNGKKFILMFENLQYLLRDQIPEDDQKMLRSFLNENPDVFIIIGTALTVFNEIENYGKPFYHFFRIRSMDVADKCVITKFLRKISAFRGDEGIEEKITSNRHYIYTYNILTGGNPRLILFLYELLIDSKELNTEAILDKISELTPYFLDKTRDESNQRKLILDALADGPPAQTATEIGEYINEDQKSISEQLKRLSAEGWVREIQLNGKNVKKKEVFFALRDYFYRIWYKVRTGDINESDTFCMAELVAILFDSKEIKERMTRYTAISSTNQAVYKMALDLTEDDRFSANIDMLIISERDTEDSEIKEIMKNIKSAYNTNDGDLMQKYAEQLSSYPSEKGKAYYFSGFAFGLIKKHKESIEFYKKTVDIRKDDHSSWNNMGAGYANLNNHKKAIECYEKATEIKKDNHESWNNMGLSYSKSNNHTKAIVCYEKAIKIKKDWHEPWNNIGTCWGILKDYKKAIECFEKTIEIGKDIHESWNNMGICYDSLNNYNKAIECYEKAIEIKKNYHESWNSMGRSYDSLNNYTKAIECYKKAVDIKRDLYDSWSNMSGSYGFLGKYEEAYCAFMKAIKYIPVFELAYFSNFHMLRTFGNSIFKDSNELKNLLDEDATIEAKMEAFSRLLFLGKFIAVSDTFDDVVINQKTLPQFEVKKLDFFIQAYIFELLKDGKGNGELSALFKSWILLNVKILRNDEMKLTRKFLEFFRLYIEIVGKEKVSLKIIEQVMEDLREKGVEISEIVLNILEAVKDPDTRKAQKWMADPLFKEIVSML